VSDLRYTRHSQNHASTSFLWAPNGGVSTSPLILRSVLLYLILHIVSSSAPRFIRAFSGSMVAPNMFLHFLTCSFISSQARVHFLLCWLVVLCPPQECLFLPKARRKCSNASFACPCRSSNSWSARLSKPSQVMSARVERWWHYPCISLGSLVTSSSSSPSPQVHPNNHHHHHQMQHHLHPHPHPHLIQNHASSKDMGATTTS